MFEGSFLRRHYPLFGNACAVVRWKLNLTDGSSNLSYRPPGQMLVYLDDSCSSEDVRLSKISLPMSLLGLLLSLFSASIFISQRQRTSFRTSLVALSVVTSGYMLFTSLDFINVLTGACLYWNNPRRHAQVMVAAVVCLMSDSLLCLRNWCNLLMTAQRTEALLFPLRVRKLLNRRNFVACMLLLFPLFLPMSLVRSLAEYFVVCSDPDGATYAIVGFPLSDELSSPQFDELKSHYSYLILRDWFHSYESHVFFIVQALIPVTLVMAFSLAMSVAMVRNRGGGAGAVNSQSKRNKARASRTVLCLATIFSALQMPSYLGHLLSRNELFIRLSDDKTWQLVAELCLFLDSIFNMFVYVYFVPDFKAFFIRLWLRLTCRPVDRRRFPLGSSNEYSRRVVDSGAEARAFRARETERRADRTAWQSQRL